MTSLSELARRANQKHEKAISSLCHGLQYAIEAGEALIEAKGQLKHGEWIPWVEANCKFCINTAGNYMRRANVVTLSGVNSQDVGNLPPDELFRLLAGQGPETEKDEKKPPRFEVWMQIQQRIVEWAKTHDKTFAIQWLRRLAEEIEENV